MGRTGFIYCAAAVLLITAAFKQYAVADEAAVPSASTVARPIAYFDRFQDWAGFPVDGHGDGSFLAREIVRQSLMIAARDELGMLTRDVLLGEPLPEDKTHDYEVTSICRKKKSELVVISGSHDQRKKLLEVPMDYHSPLDYQRLIVELEELSRTKFPAAIKDSLPDGTELPAPPPATGGAGTSAKDAEVPQDVEEMLSEMSFLSQFAAIRKLHAEIYAHGESPQWLGALVRGYANLGLLTECYSSPMNRVFRARSLLYAQRMAAKDSKSAFAQEHRAYALALLGYHALALDALAQAESLRTGESTATDAQATSAAVSPWVDLIRHYCRYECSQIDTQTEAVSLKQLAALLKFCCASNSGSATYQINAGLAALRDSPECYLISDRLSGLNGVALGHTITLHGPQTLGVVLSSGLPEMPDAPQAAREAARKFQGQPSSLVKAFADQDVSKEELAAHQAMIEALLSSGSDALSPCVAAEGTADRPAATTSVPNEFTYSVLGQIIQETIFNQILRRVYFVSKCWAVSPNELLDRLHPFYASHRYAAYIDYYSWDHDVQQTAIEQLSKVFRRDLIDASSLFIVVPAAYTNHQAWTNWYRRAYANSAETPYDFWCLSRYSAPEKRVEDARRLQTISPYHPLAKIELLNLAWDTVKDQAEKWEQEATPDQPQVLTTLGSIYQKQQRFDDAERCYKKAAEIEKSIEALQLLASVYYDQKKFDVWQETLEKALELPDYALSHSSIENQIAWHYLREREPEKALPHAEAAAQSYSGWGLVTAATVYECLQQWDKAESLYQACSQRYSGCGSDADWYFFCRRTGKGDAAAAKELVVTALANPNNNLDPFNVICYRLLNNETSEALELLETEFKKDPHPWTGILIALCADQQQNTARRDEVLQTLADGRDEALKKPEGKQQEEFFDLAATLAHDIASGGKAEFDLDQIEKSRPPAGNSLPFYYYAVACYSHLHDQSQQASDYWRKSITCTINNDNIYRTLSAAALLERGVGPEQYKDAWTTKPEAVGTK